MASIDYIEVKKELENIFKEKVDGIYRRIIFWYDEAKNFLDDIKEDTFENAKVIIYDDNPIFVKYQLEKVDVESNYLVYFPYLKPINTENWLLDILMYSDEYYADTVALTMRNLGLTNTDLRRVIEKHIKFFDNSARRKKLQSIIAINDSTKDYELVYGMMAALVKSKYMTLNYILTELVFDLNGAKYDDLNKYGLVPDLWQEIGKIYGYGGLEKIESLINTFMVTTLIRKTRFEKVPNVLNAFIMKENSEDAEIFIEEIKDEPRFRELQDQVANRLKFVNTFNKANINEFKNCDVFEDIDKIIINRISDALENGTYDFDFFERIININRKTSVWWNIYEHQYKMLLSAIAFYKNIDMNIPTDLKAEEYIKNYTQQYYLIDQYYRHILNHFKQIEEPFETLIKLEEKVNLDYETIYLNKLSRCFNQALCEKNSEWKFNNISLTNQFYKNNLVINTNKVFVIISDALRYEIGAELVDKINVNPILRGSVELEYMISPIPSITKFGMASLLPNQKIEYVDGKVLVDGMPTSGVEARDKVLKKYSMSSVAINFESIFKMSQKEMRQFMSDKSIVYIYHDVIDTVGESQEHKVFQSIDESISEILNLIKKLYNNLQITNYYVTADHGFIYRKKKINESEKYSNIVSHNALETSKRYLVTEKDIDIEYTHKFNLGYLGDELHDVTTAYGYDTFKTQGGGINYIHGGTSLQEIIVPLIKVSELRSRVEKTQIGPVGVRLKSITRKITSRTFSLQFEQYEKVEDKKVERNVKVYFVDDNNEIVSGEYSFLANSHEDNLDSRVTNIRFALKNIDFNRNKRYELIMYDTDQDLEIERIQFVIDLISIKSLF
jgi:uncharacterized protein (TIGR02687 family)